ncbi:flagellar basal body-associated FliL family protein [Marinobacterium iners]|uniref:Flagellar protein FliL n=1 Tax=Marinobacterium iners DSM 11526 TaxID=1122198 RepID=A0A1H3YEV8_9GAMM|nr:flagellar basal body-associated FliL family protein [Marinobacterium iners]SEA10115.1 flagellar FliL protein [Marinobacterium iners DSM 11526]
MADKEEAADDEQGAKGSKKKLIIILVAVTLLLLGGGGATAFFLLSGDGGSDGEAQQIEAVKREAIYTKVRTLEGKPSFVVTLQSSDGKRHYMQAFIEAKSRDPVVDEALKLHMPLIVARLNALFATQAFEELQTLEGKQALRTEATALVQSIMQEKIGQPGVETILFTNFVMQ